MPNDVQLIWERVLKILELKKGSSFSETDFFTLIPNIKPVELSKNILIIEAENSLIKERVEERLKKIIIEILNEILLLDEFTDLEVRIKKKVNMNQTEELIDDEFANKIINNNRATMNNKIFNDNFRNNLSFEHTFKSFVVGKSNEFANAAAEAVAKKPGGSYNPLFIYGGVGLGKTHLMHAIGNYVLKSDNRKKVFYCSSEHFTNDMINSIKNEKMSEFRNKYRKVDVLLIDDIQFIAGKETTQEEFFHTFNELHQAGKQIVLSSDRPPKEIDRIEKRLLSRFEWGLIVDIQQPDYETRVAILQKKAEIEKIYVSEKILRYIAESINSNIRELEGALNRVIAKASLLKKEITIELIDDVFYDVLKAKTNRVTKEKIIQEVSSTFKISEEDMKSKTRKKDIARSRQIAMYLLRNILEIQLESIGALFGGKDHSTVLHSVNKIEDEIKKNKYFKRDIEALKERINS